jgi:hypothetical protein
MLGPRTRRVSNTPKKFIKRVEKCSKEGPKRRGVPKSDQKGSKRVEKWSKGSFWVPVLGVSDGVENAKKGHFGSREGGF